MCFIAVYLSHVYVLADFMHLPQKIVKYYTMDSSLGTGHITRFDEKALNFQQFIILTSL